MTPGAALRACRADVVEIAALRARTAAVEDSAASAGARLPPLQSARIGAGQAVLCVRPDRWLLLRPPLAAGDGADRWRSTFAGAATVVDLSSALLALHLTGPASAAILARGCRLDLDPSAFPPGRAAATIIAQVATTLAATREGFLILTPSTTARHFREWLAHAAAAFGLESRPAACISTLTGDPQA